MINSFLFFLPVSKRLWDSIMFSLGKINDATNLIIHWFSLWQVLFSRMNDTETGRTEMIELKSLLDQLEIDCLHTSLSDPPPNGIQGILESIQSAWVVPECRPWHKVGKPWILVGLMEYLSRTDKLNIRLVQVKDCEHECHFTFDRNLWRLSIGLNSILGLMIIKYQNSIWNTDSISHRQLYLISCRFFACYASFLLPLLIFFLLYSLSIYMQ